MRQTLRRLRRGRSCGRDYDPVYLPEGRLRNVYFPTLRGSGKSRGWDVHERLYGFERRACQRKPLVATGCPARRVGVQRLRGQRRVCRRKPGHPGLRPGRAGCRVPRSKCGCRHGHGQQHLSRASGWTGPGWHHGYRDHRRVECDRSWRSRCAWGSSSSRMPTKHNWQRW